MANSVSKILVNNQLFHDVFHACPIGIVVENVDGQPLFVNPAFCAMLGFTEDEVRSKHCVDFSPPQDAQKDWALFQQLRAGSIDHYQIEKRYFRRDGSLVWGKLSISLLNGPLSPLVVAMVEDVTEKKKAEEANFRHTAIVESSRDAIASATLDGVIASWNSGAERMFGYTASEAVGRSVTMLVPSELPHEENRILETLRAGGRIEQFETVRITKTGKRINVSLSIAAIKDSTGEIVGCSGIARDITERKRAEEALRTSEERLRLAQQAARIGAFEWNIQTGVDTWTPELESIHGLPPGGFDGTQMAWKDLLHPDDRARVLQLVNQSLKTGTPMQAEWRIIWPDRSIHWIAGRWRVLMDESGEPSRMVGVNLDITDRKQAEEALAQVNRRLIEAQEKERARIARELHDDVGQRLALLLVEMNQLENDSPDLSPQVRHRLRELSKQADQIAIDVQSLSHELHSSRLEHLGLVPTVRGFCRDFGQQQKVEVDFKADDVPGFVPEDVCLCLFRVLQEALHNAAKHSGAGHFEVRLWGKRDKIHLRVHDSGIGFDTDVAGRSEGLGLISMQERLKLVNGKLSVESQPGQGTMIHASVPFGSERKSMLAAG